MRIVYVLEDKRYVALDKSILVEDVLAWDWKSRVAVFGRMSDIRNLANGYQILDYDFTHGSHQNFVPKDIVCKNWVVANNMATLFDYYTSVEDNGEVILISRESYKCWIREKRAKKTPGGLVFASRYIATRYANVEGFSNFSVRKYKDGYRVLVPLE